MILNVKRSAMSNLYPIYRQYYNLCSDLFRSIIGKALLCGTKGLGFRVAHGPFFYIFFFLCFIESIKLSHFFFIESIKLSHLQAIEQ